MPASQHAIQGLWAHALTLVVGLLGHFLRELPAESAPQNQRLAAEGSQTRTCCSCSLCNLSLHLPVSPAVEWTLLKHRPTIWLEQLAVSHLNIQLMESQPAVMHL